MKVGYHADGSDRIVQSCQGLLNVDCSNADASSRLDLQTELYSLLYC